MNDRVEQIVATLTPTRLRQVILELAKTQSADDPGVMVNRIIDTVTAGEDVGTGSEGWQAFLRLQQTIRDTVAQMPGFKYIEADS
jgi:hypothetical protein